MNFESQDKWNELVSSNLLLACFPFSSVQNWNSYKCDMSLLDEA